jgi:hypothetical protein
MLLRPLIFLFICVSLLPAQVLKKDAFQLDSANPAAATGMFMGNGIVDIVAVDSLIWAATGYGLNLSTDNGQTWQSFGAGDYIGKGGVSAMTFMDDSTFWIATAFDTTTTEGSLPAGGGLSFTRDFGQSWTHVRQPIDSRDETAYKPTTTNVQNLTFDIATLDSTIWICSFGGGLRRSDDMGQNWQVVTTDGIPFSAIDYLNHRAFAVISENGNLWVGTADGISKSEDNGRSWRRFTHQNQPYPISGNFIVALAHQPATNAIWAASIEATDPDEVRAVSVSQNGGETWKVVLEGNFAHNFAFDGTRAYVATDDGMFVSDDMGDTWYLLPAIRDYRTGEEVLTTVFYSAGMSRMGAEKRFWAGSADGLASTSDNGNTWTIQRSFRSTLAAAVSDAYAYPSPFSPSRAGYVRFQYAVSKAGEVKIDIYDFAMDKVASIREYEDSPADPTLRDRSAKWDGKSDFGEPVATGVYFFRVEVEGNVTWGKLVIIN